MTTRQIRLLSGVSLALLLGWTPTKNVSAQTPFSSEARAGAVPYSAQRVYWKKNVIQLPIQIKDEHRPLIREVQLFVKDYAVGSTQPWNLHATVRAEEKVFAFSAPHDGEYAFTMVTVDRQGRSLPADVRNEPPALIVCIDTQPPVLELTNLGTTSEGQLIRLEARDANLDPTRVRLQYQGGDRQYRPLEAMPTRPNVFCVPVQAVFTGRIRATAEDFAGNTASHEGHISQLPTLTSTPPTITLQQYTPDPVKQAANPPLLLTAPKVLDTGVVAKASAIELEPRTVPSSGVEEKPANRTADRPNASDSPRFPENEQTVPVASGPSLNLTEGTNLPALPVLSGTHTTARKPLPNRHIVNKSRVYLDYQIENAGPGGVAKVEVWSTRDQGQHWHKLCEDLRGKSPVQVPLSDDGLYGITLLVTNSRGETGKHPVAGDVPDWLIELDTSKPTAKFTKVQAVYETDVAVVQIAWSAQDNNFGETPVDLYYSATAQGPWLEVARGLKSEGVYRWTPSPSIGSQAFLRMVTRDLAGNVTITNTMEPVLFGDEFRPRAVIRGMHTEPMKNN